MLYDQILDDPDDVERRRVYADALQEQGDPRGEWIAVMASQPEASWTTSQLAGTTWHGDETLAALWKRHGKSWLDPLRPFLGKVNEATWWCGAIDEVKVDGTKLASGVEQVFSTMPIRTLWLTGSRPMLDALAAVPAVRCVRRLSFHAYERRPWKWKPADLRWLAAPAFAGLHEIDLGGNLVGDAAIEALFSAEPRARLRQLHLVDNQLTAAGARALASSPALASLTTLSLGANPIGDEGARALAASEHLAQLETLDLGACGVTEDGLAALRSSNRLPRLTELSAG